MLFLLNDMPSAYENGRRLAPVSGYAHLHFYIIRQDNSH